jgi:hypothetical protein
MCHHGPALQNEWRQLGVQQSRGWVHYAIHRPEPHIMLFRCCAVAWHVLRRNPCLNQTLFLFLQLEPSPAHESAQVHT